MQRRPADEQPRIGPFAMNTEPGLVGAIFRSRVEGRGVDGDVAGCIEHLKRAEIFGGGGVIEQDHLPDFLADPGDLRNHHAVDHGAQRQIIELDGTTDIGIDARGQVLNGPARQFFLVRRMSNMMPAQTAEKPMIVTTDEMISSFADIRQGFEGACLCHPSRIAVSNTNALPKSLPRSG